MVGVFILQASFSFQKKYIPSLGIDTHKLAGLLFVRHAMPSNNMATRKRQRYAYNTCPLLLYGRVFILHQRQKSLSLVHGLRERVGAPVVASDTAVAATAKTATTAIAVTSTTAETATVTAAAETTAASVTVTEAAAAAAAREATSRATTETTAATGSVAVAATATRRRTLLGFFGVVADVNAGNTSKAESLGKHGGNGRWGAHAPANAGKVVKGIDESTLAADPLVDTKESLVGLDLFDGFDAAESGLAHIQDLAGSRRDLGLLGEVERGSLESVVALERDLAAEAVACLLVFELVEDQPSLTFFASTSGTANTVNVLLD